MFNIPAKRLGTLEKAIKDANNIVLLTHTSLDPDALGSLLGLYFLLKQNFPKKQITPIIFEPPLSNKTYGQFVVNAQDNYSIASRYLTEADLIFMVDTTGISRAVKGEEVKRVLEKNVSKIIMIDHHATSDKRQALLELRQPQASCAQWIYEIFVKHLNWQINWQAAYNLLLGILGDTRNFRYLPNKETFVFSYVQELVAKLGNHSNLREVEESLELKLPTRALAVFKEFVSNMKIEGNLAGMFVESRYGLSPTEFSEIGKYVLYSVLETVKNVKIYFTVRPDPEEKGLYRCSLRSKGNIDVSALAQKYDGGGHKNASGCSIRAKTAKEAFKQIWKELKKLVKD